MAVNRKMRNIFLFRNKNFKQKPSEKYLNNCQYIFIYSKCLTSHEHLDHTKFLISVLKSVIDVLSNLNDDNFNISNYQLGGLYMEK